MDMEESLETSACCDTCSRFCRATVSSASMALDDCDRLLEASSSAATRDSRTVLSPSVCPPLAPLAPLAPLVPLAPLAPLAGLTLLALPVKASSSLRRSCSSWRSAVWRRELLREERIEGLSEAGCGALLRMERLGVMRWGWRDRNRCDAREMEGMSGSSYH